MSYKYDSDGNLLTKTDARNIITCFGSLSGTSCMSGYDALNRLTQKSYSDGTPAVTYSYDPNVQFGKGRLGSANNSAAATNYTGFDALGNVLNSNQVIAGQAYPFTYTYNLAGSLTSETYPSGRVVTTGYDATNRPYTTTGTLAGQPTSYNTQTNYAPQGAISNYWYGNVPNQVVPVYTYNSRLQMSNYWVMVNNDPNHYLLYMVPGWGTTNNNGNLRNVLEEYGSSVPLASLTWLGQSYTYDTVNRLRSAGDTGYSRTFCSDAYGNTWVTGYSTIAPAGNTPQMIGSTCPSSTTPYNAKNQINGATYDTAGNQTVVNGNTVAYDAENRQSSVTDGVTHAIETYQYDGDGKRVEKTGPSVATVYVYDALGQLAAEYSTTTNTPSCRTCYLVWDNLGSTRLVTDQNAAIVSRHDYLPFGEEVGSSAVRTGTWGSTTDVTQKFTGKERDYESNEDYFGARYYGAALGRFTSPDPKVSDPNLSGSFSADPQSWNAYSYVGNNPFARTDPDGRDWTVCESDGSNCATITNDSDFENYAKSQGWSAAGGNLYDSGGNQIGTASWAPHSDDLLGATIIGNTAPIGNALGIGIGAIITGGAAFEGYGALAGGGLITRFGVAVGPLVGLTPAERQVFEELEAAGYNVQAIPRASGPTADFLVNGVPTELKTLTSAGANTLKNAIQDAAKQGENIIVDARNVAINAQNALQQIQRAQGNVGNLQGRVTVLTKEGPVKY